MPVTGSQIAQTVLTALERKGGYIWGQSGATWTSPKQKNLEKKYTSNPEAYADYKSSAKYGSKWIGHPVWDCSGLCRWALKQHEIAIAHGSNSIWDRYLQKKGKLTETTVLPEGAADFPAGHRPGDILKGIIQELPLPLFPVFDLIVKPAHAFPSLYSLLTRLAYIPPFAYSSSWVPRSTICP